MIPAALTGLFALYGGGFVARRFGFQQVWGSGVALLALTIFDSVLLLLRELPRQGRPILFRWLMGWALLIGTGAIVWSSMQIRYDQWAVLYASIHVLTMIGIVLLFGWVAAGKAMKEIVFGSQLRAKGKGRSGLHDGYLD